MKRKHQRLIFFLISALFIAAAATLILRAFNQNLIYFYTPTDILNASSTPDKRIRVGGLVQKNSISHPSQDTIIFTITDNISTLQIHYNGIVPVLFREGQGMIAEGNIEPNGTFKASVILAKHDENYMPPEVAAALKKSGHWKDQYPQKVAP